MALPDSIDTTNDRFTVTAYQALLGVATVTFLVGGVSYPGIKVTGVPSDTVANVKAFLYKWAQAYLAGKIVEQNQTVTIDPSVSALLNVATPFI